MKNRIYIIDTWRGTAIVLMVLYHLLYDVEFIFGENIKNFTIEGWYPLQQYICWSFIFIAGFSMNLSKKRFKNGMKVFAAAMLLTIVTGLITPAFVIKFGVLHLLGLSMLIVAMFPVGERNHSFGKSIASFFVFFFIWHLGLDELPFYDALANMDILFPLGFADTDFLSSDYVPFLPWFFLFLSGYYLGNYLKYQNSILEQLKVKRNILATIGRYSLVIYLSHQVVLYLTLMGLERLSVF